MAWELSIALSNLISTVNPSLIVLGGKIPALGEFFLNEVREDLKKTGFRRMVDSVTVRSHRPENARQHTAAEIWSVTAQKIPIMEDTTLM